MLALAIYGRAFVQQLRVYEARLGRREAVGGGDPGAGQTAERDDRAAARSRDYEYSHLTQSPTPNHVQQ